MTRRSSGLSKPRVLGHDRFGGAPICFGSENSLIWWPYDEERPEPLFCTSFSDLRNQSHPGYQGAPLQGRTLWGGFRNCWVGALSEAELREMLEVLQKW